MGSFISWRPSVSPRLLLLISILATAFLASILWHTFSAVTAQTAPDFEFLNTMALPWRCGDRDPRHITDGWEEHWADPGRAVGVAIDFNYAGSGDHDRDVLAPFRGTITNDIEYDSNGSIAGYGRYVEIDAGNGWSVILAHLNSFSAESGSIVEKGQVVGRSNDSGSSDGDHIHLELLWNGGAPDRGWFNTSGNVLFSHPTDNFVPSAGSQFYSNNCGEGPTTSLYWDANWTGYSTHYFGYGNFRVPNWFNEQASSIRISGAPSGVHLFEHINQEGGSAWYEEDIQNFAGFQYHNGVGVNDTVSSLQVPAPICPASSPISDPSARALDPCIVPTPTPQPPPPASGWSQTFFSDISLSSECGTRVEGDVYMFRDSDGGWSPPSGCPAAESAWSVRMERSDAYFEGGMYEFGLFYDDGARLYVDGELVVDGWNATLHYKSHYVSPGNHHLKLEYKNNAGHAIVQLWWRGPGALPPNNQTQDPNQWWVNYWGNQTQWQDAVGSQNEGTGFLDRQWDYGGPGFGIPSDHFSTSFERSLYFNCGTYRFHLNSDDGSRLWIDGVLVPEFDRWSTGVWGTISNINLTGGYHTLKVDHFENGGAAHIQFDWSQIASCPDPPVLLSPSHFAEYSEDDIISLTWSGNSDEYYAEYRDSDELYSANSGWQTGTSWTIDPLPAGRVYVWRVKGQNAAGESYWSAPRIFTVQPATPSNLIVPTITCTGITLSWDDNSSVEEGYNIYRDGVRIASVNANTDSFEDTNPGENTTHDYYVVAFVDNVEYRASNTATVNAPACDAIPGDANGDGEVDGVDFSIWLNHFNTNTTAGPAEGDFNLDESVDGIDYSIWLSNFGISHGSRTETVITPTLGDFAPQAPSNLSLSHNVNISNTASVVVLSWDDNADHEDGFSLAWNTDGYKDIAVTTFANPPTTTLRADTTNSMLAVIPCSFYSRVWSFSASLSAFNTDGASPTVSIQDTITAPACAAISVTPTPTSTPQPSPNPGPSPTSINFPDPTATPEPVPTFMPTPTPGYHAFHRLYLPLTVGR